MLEIIFKCLGVKGTDFLNAILCNTPTENLLVHVGKKNTGSKFGKVTITLN